MKLNFEVANIKCAGCASNIKSHLQNDDRIISIDVDIDKGCVSIEAKLDASEEWLQVMKDLGYPEK